jgi:hypothetical protein
VPECDDDEERVDGECVPICGDNEVRQGGECVCIGGYERVDGECVPECDDDEERVDGECVPIEEECVDPCSLDGEICYCPASLFSNYNIYRGAVTSIPDINDGIVGCVTA